MKLARKAMPGGLYLSNKSLRNGGRNSGIWNEVMNTVRGFACPKGSVSIVIELVVGKQEMAGASKIEDFIRKVTYSLQDRLTQRERTAVYDWSVRRFNPVELPLAARNVVLPNENSRGGAFVPAEEPLLVGYYRPEKWEWIKKNGYNFRIGLRNGSLGISSEELKADYILLHCGTAVTDQLFKIDKVNGPRLVTKQEMVSLGYGDPSGEAYLLFKLIPIADGEPLHGITCDISKLPQYAGARSSTRPFTVMFQDILLHSIC